MSNFKNVKNTISSMIYIACFVLNLYILSIWEEYIQIICKLPNQSSCFGVQGDGAK